MAGQIKCFLMSTIVALTLAGLGQSQISQRIPRERPSRGAALVGRCISPSETRGISAIAVSLTPIGGGSISLSTDSDGVFRAGDLKPGLYSIRTHAADFADFERQNVELRAGEVL